MRHWTRLREPDLTLPPARPDPQTSTRSPLPRLWRGIERFAHARGAVPGTFLWNLAQGSVVPGPSELLFFPLAIAEPARAWRLAAAATAGSVLGGCMAYWLGAAAFDTVGRPLLHLLRIGDDTTARAMTLLAQYGWLFILISVATPISAKAVSIGAGAAGMAFPAFALALLAGRAARFSLDVLLLRLGRDLFEKFRRREVPPRDR